ncbi:MAG: immunoglobulin domain-containing protein [Planctomycetes bacterium]|nr:immunoglobulin domain-containing protein [Planctomycetota bacterium]
MKMLRRCVCVAACAMASAAAVAQPVGHDCVLWLRADASDVALDGSLGVMSMQDLSGAGHHAANGSAGGRPRWVADAVGGRPAIRFFGAHWLDLSGQVVSSQRYTIIAVVNDTRTEGSFHEVFSNWTFGNTLSSVFFGTTAIDPAGANTTRARLTDDVGGANEGQTGVGLITDRTRHFIFTGISRAVNAEVYQNRSLVARKDAPISTRNLAPPYVIGRQGPISEFWTGDIAEILVYDADLTRCELDEVYDYLNGRYGIAACVPEITLQPFDSAACPGGDAVFEVQAAGGACDGNFSYAWQRDGAPLHDGLTASGSVVSGAGTATLLISGCREGDARSYSCVVTNACGSTGSGTASLRVCTGDFNCDGGDDGSDVEAFFASWESGDAAADVNEDGGVDGGDVDTFFEKWSGGC